MRSKHCTRGRCCLALHCCVLALHCTQSVVLSVVLFFYISDLFSTTTLLSAVQAFNGSGC